MAARNESWVIRFTVRVALRWVDHLVILDHASTDNTPQILNDIAADNYCRVTLLREDNPEWNEMAHRQLMLECARSRGATHVAIIDADEVLSATLIPEVRDRVAKLPPGHLIRVPLHNLWRSLDAYRADNSKHGKQWVSIAFADRDFIHWPTREQFHHRHPFGTDPATQAQHWPAERALGGVMHLQRASWRRAKARQAWYKVTERLRWQTDTLQLNGLYGSSLDETGCDLQPVPPAWWDHGIDRGLIDVDAEPWQEADAKRLVAEHGRKMFYGLDLFGVA